MNSAILAAILAEEENANMQNVIMPMMASGQQSSVTPTDPIGDALRAAASAYYKLEDVTDSTTNALNLTNNNSITFGAGKIGNAAFFTSADSKYLSHSDNALLEGDTSFSLAGWFNFSDFQINTPLFIISKDGNCQGGYAVFLLGASTELMNVNITMPMGDFSAPQLILDTVNVALNTWYFLAARYDAVSKSMRLRVDVDTNQLAGLFGDNPATTEPFVLNGSSCSGVISGYGDCALDEFGFYKGLIFSDEQEDYLYNSGAGRTLFP